MNIDPSAMTTLADFVEAVDADLDYEELVRVEGEINRTSGIKDDNNQVRLVRTFDEEDDE